MICTTDFPYALKEAAYLRIIGNGLNAVMCARCAEHYQDLVRMNYIILLDALYYFKCGGSQNIKGSLWF